jgi:hypothetical protein
VSDGIKRRWIGCAGLLRVLEDDHTVILGWSPQIFTIISELVLANANRSAGAVVAILAEHDKVDMEDQIKDRVGDTKNTKVICRSGSPIDPGDIDIVSPHSARSVIVLPPNLGRARTDYHRAGWLSQHLDLARALPHVPARDARTSTAGVGTPRAAGQTKDLISRRR